MPDSQCSLHCASVRRAGSDSSMSTSGSVRPEVQHPASSKILNLGARRDEDVQLVIVRLYKGKSNEHPP